MVVWKRGLQGKEGGRGGAMVAASGSPVTNRQVRSHRGEGGLADRFPKRPDSEKQVDHHIPEKAKFCDAASKTIALSRHP